MFRMQLKSVAKGLCLLATLLFFISLTGCGDDEGDIASPSISSNVSNAFFTTSDNATLKVDVEVGAEIEVAVADGLTAGVPFFEGTSVVGDTWSFTVSSLLPGANSIAVTARDITGNQQTLFMTVTYDFLAIDRLVSPVVIGTTGFQVMGTVADATVPGVTVTASDGTLVTPVTVALDSTFSKRWIATFDLPATADLYTLSVNRNDGTNDVTKTFAITANDPGVSAYPLATIDPQDFEVVESGLNPEDPVNRIDDTLTIGGTCQTDASVTLLFNNQDQALASPCVGGNWSSEVTLQLGKNFITLTVTDESTLLSTTAYDAIWYVLP